MSSISGLGSGSSSSLLASLQQTTLSSATNLSLDSSSISHAVSTSLNPVDRITLSSGASGTSSASSTYPSGTQASDTLEVGSEAAIQALLAKVYSGS